ncbi:MAG: hypothetical protein CO091_02445 [Candidatus Aquicultor secundus]|nr:MAG: hypothetical protein CO091_02445 [Candidatus Aquicultor secundus]
MLKTHVVTAPIPRGKPEYGDGGNEKKRREKPLRPACIGLEKGREFKRVHAERIAADTSPVPLKQHMRDRRYGHRKCERGEDRHPCDNPKVRELDPAGKEGVAEGPESGDRPESGDVKI